MVFAAFFGLVLSSLVNLFKLGGLVGSSIMSETMSSTDVDQLQSEIPNELNESMSVDELVFYLNVNQGIPESFCEILKGT